MESPLRVIGYVRVSTEEQATSGLGIASQEATLRAEVERRGWELIDVAADPGLSAKDLNRPGLRAALERIVAGEADGLVVAKLDRLTRSLRDLTDLLDWSERLGVALVALDLGLDTSTPTGRLVARVMGSVVEWEREVIGQRTREAAAVTRSRGQQWGGLVGVSSSAPEVAARIAAERAAGSTWQKIADGLNADRVPTVRGGTEWRVSSVQTAAGYRRPAPKAKRAALPERARRRTRLNA